MRRPELTTSRTEAGTPDAAPLRCGTKPMRCHWSKSVERGAEQLELAAGQGSQSGQGAHERRLAGAVGAEQRDELAGLDDEVDAAQHGSAADGDGAVGELDGAGRGV